MDEVHGPLGFTHLEKRPGARAVEIIARVEPAGGVAFLGGFFEHARVTQDEAEREVRIGALWTAANQIRSRIVGTAQVAALDTVSDQITSRSNAVRVDSQRAFISGIRALKHVFSAAAIRRIEIVALAKSFPGRRISGVRPDYVFEH